MGPSRYGHPEAVELPAISFQPHGKQGRLMADSRRILTGIRESSGSKCFAVRSKFYGQAERAISNGKLNVLLRLHIRPIKLVVFQCPS